MELESQVVSLDLAKRLIAEKRSRQQNAEAEVTAKYPKLGVKVTIIVSPI